MDIDNNNNNLDDQILWEEEMELPVAYPVVDLEEEIDVDDAMVDDEIVDDVEVEGEPMVRGWGVRLAAAAAAAAAAPVAEDVEQVVRPDQMPHAVAAVARSPSYLLHLVREMLPCSLVLTGAHTKGCNFIVQYCRESNVGYHYRCPQTGRTPLHEAALRCSCIHVVRAICQSTPNNLTLMVDKTGHSPLQLLFVGIAAHHMDAAAVVEIVDQLLQPFPVEIAWHATRRAGDLALHFACAAPESMVPMVALNRLLEAAPTSASHLNQNRQTPLHLHCQRRNASTATAELLISNQEPFRCMVDSEGLSPLHYAASTCNSMLIESLVAADPFSAFDRTTFDGRTALHLLCQQHPGAKCLPAVRALLAAAPATVNQRDERTLCTPLNLLLSTARSSRNITLEIVQALVQAEPDCLVTADNLDYLPIHYACQVGSDLAVVSCLLTKPTSQALTRKRDTALSLSCAANVSTETVRKLLEINVAATTRSNDYGFLPLHCVCRNHQPALATVQALLEADPTSVRKLTHAGESPIHLAHGAGKAVLALLTTAAAEEEDATATESATQSSNPLMTSKIGNTPLHYACCRNASVESIETLAESNPSWILARNYAGYSPMQVLCKNGRIDERIVTIFSRLCGSEAFSSVDASGNTPLHSAMREETNVEALRALIHAYPDALQMRTPYGDTPLHLACLRKVNFDVLREVAQASCQCLESSSTICGSVTHRLSPLIARNRAGQSPISIAMDEYQKVMKTKHWCTTTIQTPEQAYSFEALAALVKMLHYGPGHGDERDESLVAACLSLHRNDVRLDPSFIRRALYLYPVELRVVDRDLNYPLHVEASIPVEKMVLLDAPHSSTSNCCDGACHKRMGLLHMILDIYPDAAKHRNKEGKFPLDIMIQNGRPWDKTFAYVVRAHPEVLRWLKNMSPKVVSHMLAQVANGCGIDTLYSLISKSPALLYENESGANVVHERP